MEREQCVKGAIAVDLQETGPRRRCVDGSVGRSISALVAVAARPLRWAIRFFPRPMQLLCLPPLPPSVEMDDARCSMRDFI